MPSSRVDAASAFKAAITRQDFVEAANLLPAYSETAVNGSGVDAKEYLATLDWALRVTRSSRAQLAKRIEGQNTASSYSAQPAARTWEVEG